MRDLGSRLAADEKVEHEEERAEGRVGGERDDVLSADAKLYDDNPSREKLARSLDFHLCTQSRARAGM